MNEKNPDSGELLTIRQRVTSQMVRSRTVELALIAGRSSIEIRQRDYEQAKRELTGETDFDRQHTMLHPGVGLAAHTEAAVTDRRLKQCGE